MTAQSLHSNRIIIPLFFGLGLAVSGQYLAALVAISLGIIFVLRFFELFLREQASVANLSSKQNYIALDNIIVSACYYIQQMTSVFFSCMFWMVQGNFRVLTTGHWSAAFHTAVFGASVLSLIKFSPLKPLLKGKIREFIITSIIISLVDRFIHPSHFGGPYTEAVITGLSAVGFNLTIDGLFVLFAYFVKL